MSNHSSTEGERDVVLGLLKFVATGITVTAALIGIASAISKARSLEPTYVYTIPTTLMSGPTEGRNSSIQTTKPTPNSIIPICINYYYCNGTIVSTEFQNSTDHLIISAYFINTGSTTETAELQLLIAGKTLKSKTSTLIPGEISSIFTIIPPDNAWDVITTATVMPLTQGMIPHGN